MSLTPLSHDDIEVLVAADALGGLEDAARQELEHLMAEHGPDCVECHRLEVEYLEVAGLLGTSLDPVAVSPGAEERLIAAISQEPRTDVRPTAPPRPARVREMPGRTRRWVAAAAVAAAVAVLGGVIGYSIAPSGGPPGTRAVAFPQTDGQQVTVIYEPGKGTGWVVATGMPTPQNGQVYELWYILPDDPQHPRAAGTFVPTNGAVVAPVTIESTFAALAVSVEPPGGSTTEQGPRGDIIMLKEAEPT